MATSDILGLFMSPEQYQAQQMAQQQAGEQQRAINFAGLTPLQQANYGVFMGAQQLGRGFGGLLGVQDPQLQRIRQRQEIMQSINPADPESLMAGIQRASQMGDQELALTLADYARKARGDLALAEQREREKVPEAIQIAEEIRKLTVKRDGLPEGAERNSIDAQIKRLQLAQKAAGSTETAEYKNAFQLTVAENPTLDTESADFKTKFATNLQNLVKKGGENKIENLRQLYKEKDDAVRIFGADSEEVARVDRLINAVAPAKEVTEPERVRVGKQIRSLKDKQKDLPEDSDQWKNLQEDIEFLENKREDKTPTVSAALNEISLEDFNKPYTDLTPTQRTKVREKQKREVEEAKDVAYGVDREATARAEFGKRFDDLDQNEQKAVNKIVDAERRINAPKVEVKNVLPKEPVDIAKTEKAIRDTVEPQLRTVTTVDSALATLALAKKDNNPAAFNAARVQLAKSLGDSTLSATDIRNAGGDPSLWGTIRDKTSTVVFGTPGNPTLDAVEKTLLAIRKVARKQATNTLDRQKRLARSAIFNDGTKVYTDQQIKDLFEFPDLNPDTAAGDGDKKAVPWNQLKK